jgi:hypothetical protein
MVFITELPEMRANVFQSVHIEKVDKKKTDCVNGWVFDGSSRNYWETDTSTCYQRTSDFFKITQKDNNLNSILVGTTANMISLSNELSKNARPLEDDKLDVLNKTYKRLLSKYPTRL